VLEVKFRLGGSGIPTQFHTPSPSAPTYGGLLGTLQSFRPPATVSQRVFTQLDRARQLDSSAIAKNSSPVQI
jgi:hypothetical protein